MTTRSDKYGKVQVPFTSTASVGGSLVTLADPAITSLLAAFKATLKTKLNTAFDRAGSQTFANIVEGTYAYDPLPILANRTWQWPALFMWRVSERLFNRTQVYRCAESQGRLLYVMPPMPYEMATRLEPIKVAVRTVLDAFVEQHGDAEYSSGASPLTANSLESFEFNSADYGFLDSGAELAQLHPIVDMRWTMRERQSFVSTNYVALDRIATTIAVVTEASGTASTVVAQTYYDPTP